MDLGESFFSDSKMSSEIDVVKTFRITVNRQILHKQRTLLKEQNKFCNEIASIQRTWNVFKALKICEIRYADPHPDERIYSINSILIFFLNWKLFFASFPPFTFSKSHWVLMSHQNSAFPYTNLIAKCMEICGNKTPQTL